MKARDAVYCGWYDVNGERTLFVAEDKDGNFVFVTRTGWPLLLSQYREITRLPDCTGWDWQPEPTPEHPEVPAGYQLAVYRKPMKGDLYCYPNERQWTRCNTDSLYIPSRMFYICEPIKPQNLPIPDGYVVVPGNVGRYGDKYCMSGFDQWLSIDNQYGYTTFISPVTIIRRVEPESQYRPFANAEEFLPNATRMWRFKQSPPGGHKMPRDFHDTGHNGQTWQRSFEDKVFDDGGPFGVKIQ
jgi:hypothetical protein